MEELLGSLDTCFLKAGWEPGSGFKRLKLNKGVAVVANSTPTEGETTSLTISGPGGSLEGEASQEASRKRPSLTVGWREVFNCFIEIQLTISINISIISQ